MGLVLVGLATAQKGIEANETGTNTRSVSVRYFPEFKAYLPNFQDQSRGFAVPDKYSREITIEAEVDGSTGLMALVLNVAATLANDVATFIAVTAGSNAGGIYLDEVTENQTREGWREVSFKLTSHPLIT
jgi:hypothetical protein